ncbi:MAG: class F sortase [Caldilineaceae bacterium]
MSLVLAACLVPPPDEAADSSQDNMAQSAMTNAAPPVQITIPALDLDVPVTPMGWRVTEVDGARTTKWEVPLTAAGWHVNSGGAGGQGNVVISGHQVQGEAVFAQIALGELSVDDEIDLTDAAGGVYTYRVSEVTDPIPLVGATAEETALANSYAAPTEDARLTLLTGWPADTTTHYLIVVAELVGAQ